MIEQGLAQSRMWQVGSASVEVACGDFIPGEVVARSREFVEEMDDVVVIGKEHDRALDSVEARL